MTKFNLISNLEGVEEKRILPRYPICYLTCKVDGFDSTFEVKEISFSGMQLEVKQERTPQVLAENLTGEIKWLGDRISFAGKVKWKTKTRAGIEFKDEPNFQKSFGVHFSNEMIVQKIKPIHERDESIEIPVKMKIWLHADGPIEVFVWQHSNGEIQSFQLIKLNSFVEWSDSNALRSGRVISKRNIDTPLFSEDEILFKFNYDLDRNMVEDFLNMVELIPEVHWNKTIKDFVMLKLR